MNSRIKGFLQLCRPANLPTAAADILAGLTLAGFFVNDQFFTLNKSWLLILSSILLYAGGVVLNDVFDFELDKIERAERPLPNGLVKYKEAVCFGLILLIIGISTSFLVGVICGYIALVLTLLILVYDSYSKKFSFLGPLNMGLCRGCNLLLGISVFGEFYNIEYVIIPIIYIAAITMVSQGEVHGKNKRNILLAGGLYSTVILLLVYFNTTKAIMTLTSYLFLVIFVLAIGIPLLRAYRHNIPVNIMKAVKAGVISIILLDAVIAVTFSNVIIGLIVLLLLPISMGLSRAFAVT